MPRIRPITVRRSPGSRSGSPVMHARPPVTLHPFPVKHAIPSMMLHPSPVKHAIPSMMLHHASVKHAIPSMMLHHASVKHAIPSVTRARPSCAPSRPARTTLRDRSNRRSRPRQGRCGVGPASESAIRSGRPSRKRSRRGRTGRRRKRVTEDSYEIPPPARRIPGRAGSVLDRVEIRRVRPAAARSGRPRDRPAVLPAGRTATGLRRPWRARTSGRPGRSCGRTAWRPSPPAPPPGRAGSGRSVGP